MNHQCFTHRYLGWKINVLDSCDEGEGSENHEYYADVGDKSASESDLEGDASIRVPSKVTPAPEYYQRTPQYGLRPHHHHHDHHRHYTLHYPKSNNLISQGQFGPHNMQLTRTYSPSNLYEGTRGEEQKAPHNPSIVEQPYASREQLYGVNQEIGSSQLSPAFSSRPLAETSNQLFIPDSRPAAMINSLPYPNHGPTPQILYSESPKQQIPYPHKPQMMIVKKTVRRPTILPMSLFNLAAPAMQALSKIPAMFMERKIYAPPVIKPSQRKQIIAMPKLMKIEAKPVLDVLPSDLIHNARFVKQKPRSGFDPNTVVVESGFKPIIRSLEPEVKRAKEDARSSEFAGLLYMTPPAENFAKKGKKPTKLAKIPDRVSADFGEKTPQNLEVGKRNRADVVSGVKMTLMERSKRFADREESWNYSKGHDSRVYDHNGHTNYHMLHPDHEHEYESDDYQDHNEDKSVDYDYPPSNGNHSGRMGNETRSEQEEYSLSSAGEIIVSNMGYIILTVVLYYVL